MNDKHILRIVSAAELHTESLMLDGGNAPDEADETSEENNNPSTSSPSLTMPSTPDPETRNNRETTDNPSTQTMTVQEIEKLKQGMSQAGQAIINQLLSSHSAIDKKTAFSLAKYKLRKRKKYLKRFSIEPLDVGNLIGWMLYQKDAARVLEMGDEMIGLIGCWANVHNGGDAMGEVEGMKGEGRWLVVDDTGGLVVAAMAERMGILYPSHPSEPQPSQQQEEKFEEQQQQQHSTNKRSFPPAMSAENTTLTLLHPNAQPNLSLLKYFNFDITDPAPSHPLYTNLKTLSWMQLLSPSSDPIYSTEPPLLPDSVLSSWKPNKRGLYHRKRRRWQRTKTVVDETRAGGFDGLIVATLMDPVSVLRHTVPLLKGSAHVVVYSPCVEPLTRLSDLYSSARRSAYLALLQEQQQQQQQSQQQESEEREKENPLLNTEDFPLDPTLLFGATVQTSRARAFQVLPGRTHPTMTARGGAVGYVFHAIRGLAAEGKVTARGQVARKKRKVVEGAAESTTAQESAVA